MAPNILNCRRPQRTAIEPHPSQRGQERTSAHPRASSSWSQPWPPGLSLLLSAPLPRFWAQLCEMVCGPAASIPSLLQHSLHVAKYFYKTTKHACISFPRWHSPKSNRCTWNKIHTRTHLETLFSGSNSGLRADLQRIPLPANVHVPAFRVTCTSLSYETQVKERFLNMDLLSSSKLRVPFPNP